MALESATYISGLVDTNPSGSDSISQGDDHLRLIKDVLKNSLPDVDQAAATVIVKGTAPTTQVKGTIWYDTSTNVLKMNTATSGASPTWVAINEGSPWQSTASSCTFRVGLAGTQTTANNTWEILRFGGDVDYNVGSYFNTSTYKFTAPVAGKYYFHSMLRTNAAHSSDDDMAIYKNSSAYAMYSSWEQAGGSYVSTSTSFNVSCVMDMAASDTASVYVHTEGGGFGFTGPTSNQFFEGYRIV
jgi:hypothetical protein